MWRGAVLWRCPCFPGVCVAVVVAVALGVGRGRAPGDEEVEVNGSGQGEWGDGGDDADGDVVEGKSCVAGLLVEADGMQDVGPDACGGRDADQRRDVEAGGQGACRRVSKAPIPMAMKPSMTSGKAYVSAGWMWLAAAIWRRAS